MSSEKMNKSDLKKKILERQRAEERRMRFVLDFTPYKAVENIGTGAYGVVCKAIHQPSGRYVAIKKINGAFANRVLMKRTLRELRILRNFKHENIVQVLDMFSAQSTARHASLDDIYMVMGLMETDLHQIIHSKQPLTEQHYQYFMYQTLRGLKYIHTAGIIHRDLKPSNLLINADCLLTIGDFGMARSSAQLINGSSKEPMTQYVATRWYRSPELLCSTVDYNTAVDIWSVGCIFVEMLMRRQLFPGKNAKTQIKLITHYLGTPDAEFMEKITSQQVKEWILSCGERKALTWTSILPKGTVEAQDLASKLLQMNPWNRITVEEALAHSYLSMYHDEDYEPRCHLQVIIDADAIEHYDSMQLRTELEKEVRIYHIPYRGEHHQHLPLQQTQDTEMNSARTVVMESGKDDALKNHDLPFTQNTHPKINKQSTLNSQAQPVPIDNCAAYDQALIEWERMQRQHANNNYEITSNQNNSTQVHISPVDEM